MTLDYILSMTICLIVLYGFYKLVLADNKAHHIKRIYLLLSLGFSIVAPLLTIYQIDIQPYNVLDLSMVTDSIVTIMEENNSSIIRSIFPITYFSVLLSFLTRFIYNYFVILVQFYKSPIQVFENYTLVFLTTSEDEGPYSFGKNIFVQQSFYESDLWDDRLMEHELGHVRQRHSLDIIIVELLKCVFWFQPFLYLFKKEIKFNHELLADDAVIKKYRDYISYQKLLYSMVTSRNRYRLTSNLSYSLTKKRFQMLKKKPDLLRSIITSLLSIPVFVGLLLCVGQTAYAQDGGSKDTKKEKSCTIGKHTLKRHSDGALPPPPPPPPNPQEYIQSVIEQGGSFHYNGKEISIERAEALLASSIKHQEKGLTGFQNPISCQTVREDGALKLIFQDR